MTAIEAAARALRDHLLPLLGCGDNSCQFVKAKGMGTNGGCRCYELVLGSDTDLDRTTVRRAASLLAALFRALDAPPVAPPIPKCPNCNEAFEVGHGIAWYCLVCGMVWNPGDPLAAKEPKR